MQVLDTRSKNKNAALCALLMLMSAGCTLMPENPGANTVRHRFSLAPEGAAACFARNAERRSSALVAEVGPRDARGQVDVIVRVKNGVTYATAKMRPAGQGAEGTIVLMVTSPQGIRHIVQSLVEGC